MDEKQQGLVLTADQVNAMLKIVQKNPRDLLLSEGCRKFLALDRWQKSDRHLRVHSDTDEGVMPGTITHNRKELEKDDFGSSRRTLRLLNPLSSLEPVFSLAGKLKVLSIGPRTEMEIFHLMAIGFALPNIHAVDLIACSPLIDTGDMHKLPYPDRMFDVVISSWVIGYSNTPQKAIDEMVRVCKPGALVAIGLTYEPTIERGVVEHAPTDIVGSNYGSSGELQTLLGPNLGRVYFEQDLDGGKGGVMLIASVKR
jgi:hypothetical protein